MYQVNKHLTKPGHVWSKFGSGNKVTLTGAARKLIQSSVKKKATNGSATSPESSKEPTPVSSSLPSPAPSVSSGMSLESSDDGGPIGRETRRRLVEWWSKEYCAGRMRLCIIGKGVISCPRLIAATLMHA